MPATPLHVTIIQPYILWEDKAGNMLQYEQMLSTLPQTRHLVLLPEMCTTGFSMNPEKLAETMDGPSVNWLRKMAGTHRCIIAGSFIIEEDGCFFNRLIWMQPNGIFYHYDKRHLFAFAGEDAHYTAGEKQLIVQVNGWRICPLVCYDLRFPVWSRNKISAGENKTATQYHYDVLLYLANWPHARIAAWKNLLQARSIENQCYTIGVNRVGNDGNNHPYSGYSSAFDFWGETLWQQGDAAVMHTIILEKELLEEGRSKLPFLKDADPFLLTM